MRYEEFGFGDGAAQTLYHTPRNLPVSQVFATPRARQRPQRDRSLPGLVALHGERFGMVWETVIDLEPNHLYLPVTHR
jgi:hypothetical protein